MTDKSAHAGQVFPTWRPPPEDEQLAGTMTAEERNDLPDSAYAFPLQRKEPLNSVSHVRLALSRFGQVEDVSAAERALAFQNIRAAAAYFDVPMAERSWQELMRP